MRTTGSLTTLSSLDVTVTDQTLMLTKNKLDTSTLSGTSASRQIDLGRKISYINNIQMTPYVYTGGTPYVTVGYVTSGYFDETVVLGAFPQIIDKNNGGANITVIDNNGNYIDSYVDVLVYALPEQYVDGNNIRQR